MATVQAPRPLVMKHVELVIGADDFRYHVSQVTFVPTQDVSHWQGLSPSSVHTDLGIVQWTAVLEVVQDWGQPLSLSRYLFKHQGESIDVQFRPSKGTGPVFLATVLLMAGVIGGNVGTVGEQSLSLPVVGAPTLVEREDDVVGAGLAKTSTLVDDFATLDTTTWDTSAAPGATATAGRLSLPMTSSYPGIFARSRSLAYSRITADMQHPGGDGDTFLTLQQAANPTGNMVEWFVSWGTLYARMKTDGVASVTAVGSYSYATHRYLEIEERDGTISWRYSGDSYHWTTAKTAARTWSVDNMTVGLVAGGPAASTLFVDALNITPAMGAVGDFSWCGQHWIRRTVPGQPHLDSDTSPWSVANVSMPALSNDDVVKLRLTNPDGTPVAAEVSTTRQGFGYGTYTLVVEAPAGGFPQLHAAVVFGGLFTYDGTAGADAGHNEIDVDETSAWGNGGGPVNLDHTMFRYGTGSRTAVTSRVAHPDAPVMTHVMQWAADHITWSSYIGQGPSRELYATNTMTEDIPVPRNEALVVNIWATPGGVDPATVPALTEVVLHEVRYEAA